MAIFRTKTIRTITFKSGVTITNHSDVTVVPVNSLNCGVTYVSAEGKELKFKIGYSKAHEYLLGFVKPPSIKSLEKNYSENATCKNPIGNTVEVDGEDHYGFPSWCRILLGI